MLLVPGVTSSDNAREAFFVPLGKWTTLLAALAIGSLERSVRLIDRLVDAS